MMAEKSPRRLKLEASLAEDPADTFLRYGLAVQCLREGDVEEGRSTLLALIADHPDDRSRLISSSASRTSSRRAGRGPVRSSSGIAMARKRGDWHAAAEMEGLLSQVG